MTEVEDGKAAAEVGNAKGAEVREADVTEDNDEMTEADADLAEGDDEVTEEDAGVERRRRVSGFLL